VTQHDRIGWADEMRVGLMSTVRRVWAPRGVQVRQLVQFVRQWRYLVLAVDVVAGRLWWCWTETMKGDDIASVVRGWPSQTDLTAVVWDGAGSHRSAAVAEVGFPLVIQPPYAPELNPAERVFEELRRAVEGRIYDNIAAKVAAIAAELQRWEADPARMRRLANWTWITDALAHLPQPQPIAA
jgi:DDE superfamily endonuclease